MLVGAADYHQGDWRALTPEIARRVADLGFAVMNVRVHDPFDVGDADVARTKALFEDAGLVVGQTVGDYGGGLISPDDAVRARAIDAVKRMCDLTARLEAPNTYLRPGSLNPAGAWTPDPANRSDAVFDRLVASTHEICQTAEAVGAKVAVEAGVVSPLFSPTRTRDFIVAVSSPALGFNQDPVNLVGSLDDAYDSTRLVNESFDVLGEYTIGAHVKDYRVADTLLPQFEETEIGTGLLDHMTFLRRMQEIAPTAHVLIEHLPPERFSAARTALLAFAHDAGVIFDRPDVQDAVIDRGGDST